jgi:eukaryotic-like serine/threonine-protein kinase
VSTTASPSTSPLPELDRYVVFDRLATGGMATIYLAQRKGADDICIIKVLHEHLSKDPVVGNRFLREAQVASLLDHPHIARLTDAGWDKGQFYLAMEYIAGQDLETMMFKLMEQRRMLPPELSATVGLQVLEGLDYAHAYRDSEGTDLQIVHRDLSPRNVMITYDGDVKIIDFGLARTNLGDFRTAPGMVLGTLRYMSPEQAVAEPVDQRSDLYSWSVVLYEALSGRPLVMGQNAQEILHGVVTQIPSAITERNPNLPKALDAVFVRALQKSRDERYPSAKALKDALSAAAPRLFAPKEAIGEFVSGMYAADKEKAEATLSRARSGEYTQEPTRVLGSPEFETTRAGVPMPGSDLPGVEIDGVGAAFEPTRMGLPAPYPSRGNSTLILDPSSDRDPASYGPTRVSDPNASWGSVNVKPIRRPTWQVAVAAGVVVLAMGTVAYALLGSEVAPSVPVATHADNTPPVEVAPPPTPSVAARLPIPAEPKVPEAKPATPERAAVATEPRRGTNRAPNEPSRTPAPPPKPAKVAEPEPPEVEQEVTERMFDDCAQKLKAKGGTLECLTNAKVMFNIEPCYNRCRAKLSELK